MKEGRREEGRKRVAVEQRAWTDSRCMYGEQIVAVAV
jgi:hypothetical protein